MNNPPTIFVIESGKHQNISNNKDKSEYNIRLKNSKIVTFIPEDIKTRVHKKWVEFQKDNSYAKNQSTYFFDSYDKMSNTDIVNEAPFEYTHCFGRDIEFNDCSFLADNLGFNALSSICLLRTTDKKIVLGIKKNMDSKISGFSGYIKDSDFEKEYVKMFSYILRTLNEELNITEKQISDITRTGQIYSPDITDERGKLNNKVFNNTFIVNLKISSGSLAERVRESIQFKKELLFIEDDISVLIHFVLDNHRGMSIHCIGALYNYLYSHYSEHAACQLAETLGTESILLKSRIKNNSTTIQQIIRELNPYRWTLIGNSRIASYSVAPQMWNALFEFNNMPIVCMTFGSDNRQEVLEYLSLEKNNNRFLGCNIARPWKGSSFLVCDIVEPVSERVETTNTIVKKGNKLYGYNTDGSGIVKSILKYTTLKGRNVMLIGAGGAAKTVPHYLLSEGVNAVTIVDTMKEKANKLVMVYTMDYKKANSSIYGILLEDLPNSFPEVDMIINATPAGSLGNTETKPIDLDLLNDISKQSIVAEMIYNPYYTELLQYAKNKGCTIIPGIDMLIEQAAESFKLAFGIELSDEEKNMLIKIARKVLIKEK